MNAVSRIVGLSLLVALPFSSSAETAYPSQPIHIVVPAPAGGYYDRVSRVVGDAIGQSMGQSVVVENRGGANGALGVGHVRRAAPDGYTLVMGGVGPHAIAPALNPKLSYDAVKDFDPIALTVAAPMVLVVTNGSSATNVNELINIIKSREKPMLYAHNGVGTSSHMTMELFGLSLDLKVEGVPYKGSAPATMAVMSGEAEMSFMTALEAVPLVQNKKVRALAVAGNNRLPTMPDTPTLAESNINIQSAAWAGLLAPAGTPREAIDRINAEVNKALADPAVRSRLAPSGELEFIAGTPEDFRDYIASEISRWTEVGKKANITLE